MWSVWSKRLPQTLHLALGESFWRLQGVDCALGGGAGGWSDALEQVQAELARRTGSQRLWIWVSARIAPALWVTPPAGLRGGREWQSWLRQAVPEQDGLGAAAQDRWIWAESDRPRATVAVSMNAERRDALLEGLAPHGRLMGLRPLWHTGVLASRHGPASGCALFDGDSALFFQRDQRRLLGVRSLAQCQDMAQANAWLNRICRADGLERPPIKGCAWPQSAQPRFTPVQAWREEDSR